MLALPYNVVMNIVSYASELGNSHEAWDSRDEFQKLTIRVGIPVAFGIWVCRFDGAVCEV